MYWSDRIASEIIKSGKFQPYHVDDMFTPSGYAHIGSLRGPLIHDLAYKSLKDQGENPKFTYIINDFDPLDGLPPELEEEFSKYLGLPLRQAPSPEKEFDNFADFFAADYLGVLKKLGVEPEILSSWDMYHQGKFDEVIKEALDAADEIQEIYLTVSGSKKREQGWLPLQVICPNCGKIGTTRVHDWDGETVAFTCEPNMVSWAKGCGETGRISPFGGNGKLPWKVDWPAHWKVLGVTIEGAGKDHSVAGGSRDVARELCKRVFHIEEPFNLPYEFFTLGGKKMSASKGLGLKARDLFDILPPEVGRFLFCRTDYRQEIDFDLQETMAIPDLFDEYDRCWRAFAEGGDEDFARVFEMAQIGNLSKKGKIFLPRFRDVVNYMQQAADVVKKFEGVKGEKLTEEEIDVLKIREKYARIWLEKYAPEEFSFVMSADLPSQASELTGDQRKYLAAVSELLEKADEPEKLQLDLYNLSKEMNVSSKDAFSAIYTVMSGKAHGPKAGSYLLQFPKEKVVERLKEAADGEEVGSKR